MSGSDGSLAQKFGQIDIYLFDQLLKDRIRSTDRVLDAGCGSGRNILYLMRMGCRVSAVDTNPDAVSGVRELAHELKTGLPDENFRIEAVENLSFDAEAFDVVLSSAVLHFARDAAHFRAMVDAMWRVLRPGGMLWVRLASSIGAPERSGGQALFTYLVTPEQLEQLTAELGGQLLDPIKTTLVHRSRSMTTWVVRKSSP
ncbi:MAG: class I SAM-dependent methyltransferase [Acidobacteria bacterium]|nr:MAG: class I SAM-dependent methyltransferase [Acidobacteriota bacterium]